MKPLSMVRNYPIIMQPMLLYRQAHIYESEGDLEMAENYFKQCLKMPNKEYRRSIATKSQGRLEQVKG